MVFRSVDVESRLARAGTSLRRVITFFGFIINNLQKFVVTRAPSVLIIVA